MRIKKGFTLRDICGETIVIGEGKENVDFTNLIRLNESSAYLWRSVGSTEFTPDTLADLLCKEYDVDHDTARTDAAELCQQWKEAGIAED